MAFSNCSSLENIVFPTSLKIIKDCSFSGCDKLDNVVIPSNVEYIDFLAFGKQNGDLEPVNIFLEHNEVPSSWHESWNMYYDKDGYSHENNVYVSGQWEYVDGVPTPKI